MMFPDLPADVNLLIEVLQPLWFACDENPRACPRCTSRQYRSTWETGTPLLSTCERCG